MKGALIELRGVERVYRVGSGEVRALRGLDLAIAEGEMVAVMGPSGSGKSTFLNLVGLLDRPTAGEYRLGGEDTARLGDSNRAALRGRTLGFVFQAFHLLPNQTALSNAAMPLTYGGGERSRAESALARVGLADRANHLPGQLSGGQQGRVAIARALVNDPRVILADEPTGALDSRTGLEILALFQELNAEGRTLIVVTHEEEVARCCGRILRFRDGRLVSDAANPSPTDARAALLALGPE